MSKQRNIPDLNLKSFSFLLCHEILSAFPKLFYSFQLLNHIFFLLPLGKTYFKKAFFTGSFCQGLCPFCVQVSKRSQKWTQTDWLEPLSTHPSLANFLNWLKDIVHFVLVVINKEAQSSLCDRCLSLCLSDLLSVCNFVCLSFCPFICLSVYLSAYLSICLPICLNHNMNSERLNIEKCESDQNSLLFI